MNFFKAAEQLLLSLPTLERALENLQRREKRLLERNKDRKNGGMDYSKPFTDSRFVNDTLNELLELPECEKSISDTKAIIAEIRSVLDQLSDEHQKILTLWYIEKRSKETIMEKLYISSLTTVYSLRNKAVAEFALRYYGAPAIPSLPDI